MAHITSRSAPSPSATVDRSLAVLRGAPMLAGDPAEQLLRAMHTVKSARFNAAERYERKNLISLFSMSMVSLYFVGLSVCQAVYAAQIGEPTNRLLTLVSIMSSVFTLILALIEAMNDYKLKAHHLHACALSVNELVHELTLARPVSPAIVQDFRRRYSEVVRGCPYNHARVDYLMARAEGSAVWSEKAWAQIRFACDVYGLYGLCLATPPLVLAAWW